MKKILLFVVCSFMCFCIYSQQMHVKKPNFNSFRQDIKKVTPLLDKRSSAMAKQHPEYGILPYNAQCNECVELIDERTLTSRQFIDPQNAGHTYSQQSYFPLHYKRSPDDIWRTIDRRLRPDPNQQGVYIAVDQPVPTKCDLNKKSTSLNTGELEFEFNKDLTMYFFDENIAYTKKESGNYSSYTIGEEGLQVKNMWDGIDMQQLFRAGEVETNYVINAPLQLPIAKGWMVIEDHFTLPQGYTFEEAPDGERVKQGDDTYYKGDYLLKNTKGETLITYKKPVYVDAKAWGMHGTYKLLKTGNDYTLQMFVPIEWLNKADNTYPLFIDPIVFGATKIGNFRPGPSANMGYSTTPLTCDYHMQVAVPGASQLTNAYVDVEYELTYDNTCGSPPESAPYCTFSQVSMVVVCDTCGTTTGNLMCDPASPPYTGTCTTDSDLVPGAHSILINTFVPNYLACIPPQCMDYLIAFTLKNSDSICGDVCGYLCAIGNMWEMTIEACTVGGYITQNQTQACPGQPVTFTAHPSCGVPPYHYIWINDNVIDTIYGSQNYTVYPQQNINNLICSLNDTCGKYSSEAGPLSVTVTGPPANAGPDIYLCKGGAATLGGNPTTSNGTTVVWAGSDSAAQSWLSDTAALNPQINVPAGTTGTFFYLLTVIDTQCHASDTVFVFSIDTLTAPVISVSGDTLTSSIASNNQWYLNDTAIIGATAQKYVITGQGSYTVRTIDTTGCSSGASAAVIFTGVADLTRYTSVIIYPNPASTELIIKTSNFPAQWITVYDLNGQKISEQKFAQKIDISKLSPGAYFIEIKGVGGTVQRKFVKMNE